MVTLRNGCFGCGVVARLQGRMALGYFFGPKTVAPVSLVEVTARAPNEAVAVWRFGDLHLHDGKWPIIGSDPNWPRERWPVPDYIRRDPLRPHIAWRIVYEQDASLRRKSEARISADTQGLELDELYGTDAVEIALAQRLNT